MIVEIFDVKAGACALILADDGRAFLIDCGNNPEENWEPGAYLKAKGIREVEVLFVTNYDEDHVRGYPSLGANGVAVRNIHRNRTLTPQQIRDLKDEDARPGAGLQSFVTDLERKFTAAGTVPASPGFGYSLFHNSPADVGMDSNDLSLLVAARCNGWNFLFTGDLQTSGWDKLDAKITAELKQTHVLLAPHHGRENGLWEGFKTRLSALKAVVISDKGYMYDTQKAAVPFYGALAHGLKFGAPSEDRYVLTTRNDGSVRFSIDRAGLLQVQSFDESYH